MKFKIKIPKTDEILVELVQNSAQVELHIDGKLLLYLSPTVGSKLRVDEDVMKEFNLGEKVHYY